MGCASGFWADCGEGRATLDIARMGEDASSLAIALLDSPAPTHPDTERIDWLDSHPYAIGYATGYRGAKNSWMWHDPITHAGTEAESLRAAIDVARKESHD